jgi:hypothetical protein
MGSEPIANRASIINGWSSGAVMMMAGFGLASPYGWVLIAADANDLTRFLFWWRRAGTTLELVLMILTYFAGGIAGVVLFRQKLSGEN